MSNVEHEYGFKVNKLEPFFKYCENNNYDLVETTEQIRTIYKKEDNTMLRLTINKINDKVVKELDFKQDNLSNNPYIERKESLPITYEDD